MTEEMIAKAREAQSAEELLQLAKDNGMEEFTMQDAEDLYAQMHASGEMSDEEMENVSGGGCTVKVDGKKYTVVTSGLKCFTGKYDGSGEVRSDHKTTRVMWTMCSGSGCCGFCNHLGITSSGTGYCEVEFD